MIDLKEVAPDHRVEAVQYCKGQYSVKLKDGSVRQFKEFDLRLKIDSGPKGPEPGGPALIRAGMKGDRAYLIFSAPAELKAFLNEGC